MFCLTLWYTQLHQVTFEVTLSVGLPLNEATAVRLPLDDIRWPKLTEFGVCREEINLPYYLIAVVAGSGGGGE